MTWVNVIGVRNSIGVTYFFTVMKLLPLSLLILFGLGHIEPRELLGSGLPEMDGFGETILILLYAYVGFEGTVVSAGEGKNPRRDMPAALIQPILLIGLIYFLVQTVAIFVMPQLTDPATVPAAEINA